MWISKRILIRRSSSFRAGYSSHRRVSGLIRLNRLHNFSVDISLYFPSIIWLNDAACLFRIFIPFLDDLLPSGVIDHSWLISFYHAWSLAKFEQFLFFTVNCFEIYVPKADLLSFVRPTAEMILEQDPVNKPCISPCPF